MAAAFQRSDILTAVGFSDGDLTLKERQELGGREANGAQPGISYGSGLWLGNYVTEELFNDQAADFQTIIESLDGILGTFEAWDLRRPVPRAHRDGSANNGVLASVNANNKALSLTGLKAGQTISRGDFLSFDYGVNRALHKAAETIVADGSGATAEFEVRPHLRAGWSLGTAINLKTPRGIFVLVKDSFQPRRINGKRESYSFQAAQFIKPGFYAS